MRISIVVAAALNSVIGQAGGMPWRMPSDLRRFRALTMGRPLIMGRKTFQSLPKALDGRDSIVVTRDPAFAADGAIAVTSLETGLELARVLAGHRGVDEVMVIGGAEIYALALPLADRIYLTRIEGAPAGDTWFAEPDPAVWLQTGAETIEKSDRDQYPAKALVFDRLPSA